MHHVCTIRDVCAVFATKQENNNSIPFDMFPCRSVRDTCPRLLVNKEKAGRPNLVMRLMGHSGLDFDSASNYR